MKAAITTGYGGPDVLKVKTIAIPRVEHDEILIRVHASSVTTADTMMRTGKPYIGRLMLGLRKPKFSTPGTGFSGLVVAKGNGVSQFEIGDAVFGENTLSFSTNAEYLKISAEGIVLEKPENLSHEEAAAFGDGPITSYNFLVALANIQAGQHILINGAAGSLGSAAVQIAKYQGAKVSVMASKHNFPKLKELGADFAFDYKEQSLSDIDTQFDLIYDAVGKSNFSEARKVLKENGAYYSPVLNFGLLLHMMRTHLFRSKQKAHFAATGMLKDAQILKMLKEVLRMHQEGGLKVTIDRQYPLDKIAEAHAYIGSGHKKFNLVLRSF